MKAFLHRSGSAGVTCGTAPPEAETGVKHAGLMSGMCSLAVLCSLVTAARAGSKPAAVQLSEQTRLGLFRKQCAPTPEGRVALPNTLALASTSTCCFHSRVNALSEPRGSQQICALTALHTWQEICWLHCTGVEEAQVRGALLAPNVVSEAGSRQVYNSSPWCEAGLWGATIWV